LASYTEKGFADDIDLIRKKEFEKCFRSMKIENLVFMDPSEPHF